MFISDGTNVGVSLRWFTFKNDSPCPQMITAARALARKHTSGKYHSLLSFEDFDNLGHVITNSVDSLLTDSANSASSYATGHKSSVNALGVYADSSSDPFDDPKVELITELIRRRQPKKAIGIVSTAYGQVSRPDPIHLDWLFFLGRHSFCLHLSYPSKKPIGRNHQSTPSWGSQLDPGG